ncbi:acetyl-CoA synthetase-like protein [Mycena vitilis]|nr:acetyl-CoA synthetase-like protein [Mycena vitilis]
MVDSVTGRSRVQVELKERVWNLANGLNRRFSIGASDTVGLVTGNHLDFPVAIWAAHRLGASVFTVNPAFTVDELMPSLADMKPSLLIVEPAALQNVLKAASQTNISADRIVLVTLTDDLESLGHEFLTLEDLVEFGQSKKHEHQFNEFKLKPGEGKTKVALYFPSSGTTGLPKMVAIPHAAFISNIIQTAAHDAGIDMSVPVADRRFKPGNVSCLMLPMFHIFGLLINLHYMLFSGVTVVIMPKFDFVEYLATIETYRITNLSLVPPILTLFCKHPAMKDADLSSLRVIFVGGAPVSVHLAEAMGEIVPQAVVEQGYGMTELTGILTMPPLHRRVATEAVGHSLPGCTARVVKPDGSLAGVGETGELYVAGPSLATHYVNNEQLSNATFVDGWVRTGDEVYFDEDQELHIVDRIKVSKQHILHSFSYPVQDFIKVGGYQVAPAELEAHLVANPNIADCCVVGVPHEFSGEVPKAYAVLSKDAWERIRLDPEEGNRIKMFLIEDLAANKAEYKRLLGGIEFIDAIPKTSSGKLLRRALRTVV